MILRFPSPGPLGGGIWAHPIIEDYGRGPEVCGWTETCPTNKVTRIRK